MKTKTAAVIGALTGALSASTHVLAAGELNAEALKKLIVGKTSTVEVVGRGSSFRNYFDASGKCMRDLGGKTEEGSYLIKDDGMHCVTFGGNEACDRVTDHGDGTYGRRAGNGAPLKWVKIVDGNEIRK